MLSNLNKQQRDVCFLISAGKRNKEIAKELDIALRTVELRRTEIARALNIPTHLLPVWVGQHAKELQAV